MKQKIIQELENIEKKHAVRIILASESGSRAWGFPSNDSDYDVRFIYVNKTNWYLTIDNKRDVIELPVDAILDINGWDLKKALQLLRKSNSPLMEWLSSPIKYRVLPHVYEKLSALSRSAFLPETSCHHYLSMARKSVEILNGDKKAKLKTYMYAIRPMLCCEWIIQHLSQPPMNISDLLTELDVDKPFKDNMNELIDIKKRHSEKYRLERSEFLDSYINHKIATLQERIPKNPPGPELDLFDDVFRETIAALDF
jgi:predicted nucleotidyltransferase